MAIRSEYYYSHIICFISYDNVIFCSVFWVNGPSGDPRRYPSLIPGPPRVIDPANPANNVWKSGVKFVARGERQSNHDMGDGNTAILVRNIHTIDLENPL